MTADAETYPSRNLAYGYINGQLYFPTSWYSTDIPGSYNWAANEWTKYDNGSWLQASREAIEYCMDPRNFFDDVQIFQFMDTASALSYEDSLIAVQSIFKSDYLSQSGEEARLYDYVNEDGTYHYLTYAEAISQIGLELNLNQVTLASRLYQENSGGKSPLVTGNYTFYLSDGSEIKGGYYNHFNVNASGNSNSEIITNGLRKAYNSGWNTVYKSLKGGAEEIMKSFVSRGQTTTYSQKFNVDSSSSRLFWGQYMQNITAPQTESQNIYKAMVAANAVDSDLTFIIPVFKDMPEDTEYPTKDGNPNYKIGAMYINGESIVGFNADKVEYIVETESDSIKINLLAYAQTSTLTYKDQSNTGKLSLSIDLDYGENILDFVCTAENGDSRIYRILATRIGEPPIIEDEPDNIPEEPEDIPEEPPVVEPPVETPTEPEKPTETPQEPDIEEPDENPEEEPKEEPPIDDRLEWPSFNPETPETAITDLNADGEWDIFDAALIYSHILGTKILPDEILPNADLNQDGEVDIFDAAVIYQYILGHRESIG